MKHSLVKKLPNTRFLEMTIHRYRLREITLGKAADLAGVGWARMKEILVENGVPVPLGAETVAEARKEVRALRDEMESP